ncbi:MAG: ribose 5-phosphate isomerase B [Magnetococcales bacterium]|nr:ribose 5-phosphate isomerase B [Magnetococcales bacterium]
MHILIACDHGALELKQHLLAWFASRTDFIITDLGTSSSLPVDYPDLASRLCQDLLTHKAEAGILLCGTGLGMSIAANRFPGIRATLCHDEYTARLSRQHNNANVLVLGGRTTGKATAEGILEVWLTTPFEGGRHQTRLDKIESGCSPRE